jgi:hypothetical protein
MFMWTPHENVYDNVTSNLCDELKIFMIMLHQICLINRKCLWECYYYYFVTSSCVMNRSCSCECYRHGNLFDE